MSRRVVWLQLLIGWLPVWALFTTLILTAHANSTPISAWLVALRMMLAAAALGLVVQRFTERLPWQPPVRPSFVAVHLCAAFVFAFTWFLLNSVIESAIRGKLVINIGYGIAGYLMLGIWLYVMIAGVSYTTFAMERAARAEAMAAKSQLAALRSQLNPHFLFNALHAVVQLIPREPKRAAEAAEQLAGLLRGTIEEDRDLVPMRDEWAFVERYLQLERIRFGDRLRVHVDMPEEPARTLVPLFAVQTLVENAVRHGAAPNLEPTDVTIRAATENGTLTVTVTDSGAGASDAALHGGQGTGLKRLRERLVVLYGSRARLELDGDASNGRGFRASLVIPRAGADE
jgi:hypothetical protein